MRLLLALVQLVLLAGVLAWPILVPGLVYTVGMSLDDAYRVAFAVLIYPVPVIYSSVRFFIDWKQSDTGQLARDTLIGVAGYVLLSAFALGGGVSHKPDIPSPSGARIVR